MVVDADVLRVAFAADVGRERVEVAGVGLERVLRERALDAQVVEVRVDPALEVHVGEGRAARDAARAFRRTLSAGVTPRQLPRRARARAAARGSSSRISASPDERRVGPARGPRARRRPAPLSPERCTATTPGGMRLEDARRARRVHRERVEVARVHADDARPGGQRRLELAPRRPPRRAARAPRARAARASSVRAWRGRTMRAMSSTASAPRSRASSTCARVEDELLRQQRHRSPPASSTRARRGAPTSRRRTARRRGR